MTAIAARCRLLLAGLATAAMFGAPATAGAAPAPQPGGCPDVAVSQPFSSWGDAADYFLAPDGDFEGDDWALRGRADVVRGTSPFGSGAQSLLLLAGGAATSAPFCIGVEHRTMRFFARAKASSSLNVDVLYTDARGRSRSEHIGELSGTGSWAPTDIIPMVVNSLAADRDNAMTVQIRLASHGSGEWSVDNVFVDPYRSR